MRELAVQQRFLPEDEISDAKAMIGWQFWAAPLDYPNFSSSEKQEVFRGTLLRPTSVALRHLILEEEVGNGFVRRLMRRCAHLANCYGWLRQWS